MTNLTREIFDFAQLEPLLVDDIEAQVRSCTVDEVDHLSHVATAVLEAIARVTDPVEPHELLEIPR